MKGQDDVVIQSSAILGAPFRQLLGGRAIEGDKAESVSLGSGVWVGHFAVIGARSKIGDDSIVDDFCYLQTNVTIGARTLITHRAQICSGASVGSDCIIGGFIGDGVRIADRVRMFGKAIHLQHDPTQPWDAPESEEVSPLLDDDCFVGFDAKIIGAVRIGEGAYVTANAIVTRDVPPQHIATRVNQIIPASEWRGRLPKGKFQYPPRQATPLTSNQLEPLNLSNSTRTTKRSSIDMQSTERSISIRTPDGYTLAGIFVDVKDASRLAIFCHGINSHKQEYLDMFPKLATRLARIGISSIRFDFRGHGESSGGSQDFDVIGQLIDLDSVIRWVDLQHEGRFLPKAFVGVSFGAAPGIFLCATDRSFSSISLVAPVLSYSRTFLNPETPWGRASFNERAFEHAQEFGYLFLDGEFRVSIRLLEQMKLLHPETTIGSIEEPVLLIHGTTDALVPYQISEGTGVKFPQIETHIIKNMDHGLFVTGDDEGVSNESIAVEDKVLDLIVKHIRGC